MPNLLVRLHGAGVGILRKDARTSFTLSRAYLELARRPVLGQTFEDDLRRRRSGGGGKLPAFFSNLLPEGALRERLAKSLGVAIDDEFALLAALGEDLPGAVTAVPIGDDVGVDETPHADEEQPPSSRRLGDGVIRFSLAGVQLKFSMLREGDRLTYPASGQGGKWIVKLPSPSFPALPENEHATMTWAERAGIRVAQHELIPLDRIEGLPSQMVEGLSGSAFVTRRYDRLETDRRVHQEDFAQVLDVYPDRNRKYEATNYETVSNLVYRLSGAQGLHEMLRRLAFMVLSGNGDAHLKNWSLIYPDHINAELSPAYDLVATIQYIPNETLALNLAKSKSFDDVTIASFQRLARKIGVDEAEVVGVVRETAARTLDSWRELREEPSVPRAYRARVDEHLRRLRLARST